MTSHSKSGRAVSVSDLQDGSGGALRVPRLVQWMATLRCSLSCPHCLAVSAESDMQDMSLGDAKQMIDQVAAMGVEEFLITGGEPMVRADLPEIIEHLGLRAVPYSMNTAVCPPAAVQAAMRKHPPIFAAVSLDGPREVHDQFRGRDGAFDDALAAMAVLGELCQSGVAAGTTVTSVNFPYLAQTFLIVLESSANSWGIHLPVPEGRAARRKDLFLSKPQLRRLLDFVAAKRNYFPVQMADEMGYCGDYEPLVRDEPLVCGAGRAQCVVLPDGSVVPCTTLDRSCSAGNLLERPLAEIWRDGFAEIRLRRPQGRCARCQYEAACNGGCWLQRRHGDECYREVWHVPAALKTAAGVAVCLGAILVGSAQGDEGVSGPNRSITPPPAKTATPGRQANRLPSRDVLDATALTGGGIEEQVLLWTASSVPERVRGRDVPSVKPPVPDERLLSDPAWKFFASYRDGTLPADLPSYVKAVQAGLDTKQRSLGYAALLWRSMTERLLADQGPAARSAADRKLIRQTLTEIETAGNLWRKEIFDKKLDPYLARDRQFPRYSFEMSKAILPTPQWLRLVRETAVDRWGQGDMRWSKTKSESLEGWLKRHPFAEHMAIPFSLTDDAGLSLVNAQGRHAVKKSGAWGVYDILLTPGKAHAVELSLDGTPIGKMALDLPADCELTYADLLRLIDQQYGKKLAESIREPEHRVLRPGLAPLWPGLLLPMQKLAEEQSANPKDSMYGQAAAWLADFWLF